MDEQTQSPQPAPEPEAAPEPPKAAPTEDEKMTAAGFRKVRGKWVR